jgi:hypothetical protein
MQALEAAGEEVDAGLAPCAEDAQAPLHPDADAAGGDGRARAALEAQMGDGEVRMLRHDAAAGRPHLGEGRGGEAQHQVEVVDHQVEHHRDIEAARAEGGDAGRLEAHRPASAPLARSVWMAAE